MRVGTGGASVASVGSEAGKLHRVALARVKSTIDLTTGTPQVMDLCHSTSQGTDTDDSEGPGF